MILKNVSRTFKKSQTGKSKHPVVALKAINLELPTTGLIAIMGASGSGKTTLLNMVSGIDRVSTGEIIIDDQNLKNFKEQEFNEYRNKNLGFVFQNQYLIPHLSVVENVEVPLIVAGIKKKERRKRALEAIKIAELQEQHISKMPSQLSGGELQRVQIARAIINNPRIILADEPTSALDEITKNQIMALFKRLSSKCLVLIVTHQYENIKNLADRLIVLEKGVIKSDWTRILNNELLQVENIVSESEQKVEKHRRMPFLATVKLAFQNMFNKKARTLIMSLASSIGIAALSIVLSVSLGLSIRVAIERDENLKSHPVIIGTESNIYDSKKDADSAYLENAKLTKNVNIITDDFIENCIDTLDPQQYKVIKESWMNMRFMTRYRAGVEERVNFQFMPEQDFLLAHYEIVNEGGRLPSNAKEMVLIVDENNAVSLDLVAIFGISRYESPLKFNELIRRMNENPMKPIFNNNYYSYTWNNADASYKFLPIEEIALLSHYSANTYKIEVVGILRQRKESKIKLLEPGFLYTKELYEDFVAFGQTNWNSETESNVVNIVEEQKKVFLEQGRDICVVSGFDNAKTYLDKIAFLKTLGWNEYSDIYTVKIYVNSIKDKENLFAQIALYNQTVSEAYKITYLDSAGNEDATIGAIERSILQVLTIFAIAALAISSILIMSLMLSSVKERTREIGILRAIGSRRQDILKIFMIEVGVIGLIAGFVGIALGSLINIAINSAFVGAMGGGAPVAVIKTTNYILAVALSFGLALFAGFIPSLMASLKPPIEALKK